MDLLDPVCDASTDDDILTLNTMSSSKPMETQDDATTVGALSMSSSSAQQDLLDFFEDFGEKESSASSVTSFSLDNEDLHVLDKEMFSFQDCCETSEENHITKMDTDLVFTEILDGKSSDMFQNDFELLTGVTSVQMQPNELESLEEDLLVSSNDLLVDTGETNQASASPDNLDLPGNMENKPEISKDKASDVDLDAIVDDILGSAEVDTSGAAENITDVWATAVNDLLGANNGDDNDEGEEHLQKETSPEISVDLVNSEETIVQKDADSEKVLLRNKGEDQGTHLHPDRISSEVDEDNQKSSDVADMDFAVLELDSSHLNLDHSKQKRSLSKKGSISRRKRPSRSSFTKTAADSPETLDTADPAPQSPASGPGVDEVFGDQQLPADNTTPSAVTEAQPEASKARLSAIPFKPPLLMPGLQDLSKSKLFNQERRSSEGVEPDLKSPGKSQPPVILPKPATKVQKDSQNFHVSSQCSGSESANGHVNSLGSKHVTDSADQGKMDSISSISSRETSQADGVGSFLFGAKVARADSVSSVDSSHKLSRGDSTSSVETVPEVSTPPRKGSITSSAYTPIGFRPRHGSVTVLDADNKVAESGLMCSTPSAAPEVKKIQPVEPVWLAEMKARQEGGDGDLVAVPKLRSSAKNRNSSGDSSGDVKSPSSPDEVSNKMLHEREPEKPSWLKAVTERTQQGLKSETDRHENGQDNKDGVLVPPWGDKLKRRSTTPKTDNKEEDQKVTSQTSGSTDSSPVVHTGRNQYVPSWLKTAQLQKKSPSPLGLFGAGPAVSNRGDAAANSPAKLMSAYETPKWKLDLAEKKKQRETGSIPEVPAPSETNPEVPQWRKQLSQRKKQSGPLNTDSDMNAGNAGLDWAKQAEERRARLLKSGLLNTEPQQ